jgi:hypothetical protein
VFDIISELETIVDTIEKASFTIKEFVLSSHRETEDNIDVSDEEDSEFVAPLFSSFDGNLEDLRQDQLRIAECVKNIKSHIREATIVSKIIYDRWVTIIEQSSIDVRQASKNAIERLTKKIITQATFDEIRNAIFMYRSFLIWFNELVNLYNQGIYPILSPLVSIDVP